VGKEKSTFFEGEASFIVIYTYIFCGVGHLLSSTTLNESNE